jgi:RimJ/RimL family protein N-acetyltransferase
MLHTSRLVLEPITEAHAPLLLPLVVDDRLYQYQPHWLPTTLEELQERFAIYETGKSRDGQHWQLNWAIRRHNDGAYVGMVQVTFRDKPQIGYQTFTPYWQMGYGKEAVSAALDCLKSRYAANSVITLVDEGNVASIALLGSLGFARSGTVPSEFLPGHIDFRYERTL